jgi:uncharacterized protein
MNKVTHFEIPADDIERAKAFYMKCFGWKIDKVPDMDYNSIRTVECDDKNMPKEVGAINGGLIQRNENQSGPTMVINVEDIHDAIQMVKDYGGDVFTGVFNVGAMGLYALFKDTEGNTMGLWQSLSQ